MPPLTLPPTLHWRPLPAPLDARAPAAHARTLTATFASPCRRCLRDASAGEKVVLLSYDAFLDNDDNKDDSPYRGRTAIFVHAEACEPADVAASGVVPEQQASRTLAVRAFDAANELRGSEVVEAGGARLVGVCERLLAEEGVAFLHLHYAAQGCFAVRVERA
ncbi:uncharacterized protein LTHEOB_6747 [Neofusicoccum parvum]|uniref:Uncharacterized protein LTHEOB_6747 n=1 Tax=Neofusicoccum parvum TaxID=310453 RepID=A0ACB5SDP4_9PEZI|nr:uncharacterized protein LTHEOB_6747 [Neofusicoccum parvum]